MHAERQTDGQTDRRDETIGALAVYAKATSYRSRFLRLDKKKQQIPTTWLYFYNKLKKTDPGAF